MGSGALPPAAGREAGAGAGLLARRVLGRTGCAVSVVGFPGLVLRSHDQAASRAAVRRALERGINYFDVAPAYGRDGECEVKLGVALEGVARDRYFLSCKTKLDDAAGARRELEQSLRRLKTDHLDLYQLHCLEREGEVRQALGGGGALEVILKAKEEGKVRHIGFSAHTTEAALAAMDGFAFDTCMFPINFVEFHRTGFGGAVIERAAAKGVALIAIKPNARGRWPAGVENTRQWWYRPIDDPAEMRLAMRWALGRPGVATTLSASFLDVLEMTLDAVGDLRPVSAEEEAELKRLAAGCEPIFQPERRAARLESPHDRRWA